MKKTLATSFLAAVLGGGVTAGVLLGAGVVEGGTKTIVQQAPLAGSTRAAADSGGETLTAREIYRRDAPGVVFIRAQVVAPSESPFDFFGQVDPQPREATGSGFVIDEDGHVLTNAHVVANATKVTVTFSDERVREARIVGKDESTDLALLKLDPEGLDLRPLELGDSDTVAVGDPTVAIGNPFGFDQTLTTGVVSALQRQIRAPNDYTIENVIQTDAAINPGNSGGPLIDATGKVIGINSQIATGGGNGSVGIGFAVPINTAKRIVSELKDDGRVERAWLGVEYVTIDGSLDALNLAARSGLLVQQVVDGGPADKAGLRGGDQAVQINGRQLVLGGDVITRIDGVEMEESADVQELLERKQPGDEVRLEILREGRRQQVEVTLGNRPAGRPAG